VLPPLYTSRGKLPNASQSPDLCESARLTTSHARSRPRPRYGAAATRRAPPFALLSSAMGFQGRLDELKDSEAAAASARADAEALAKADRLATAQNRAKAMLPELTEAADALRVDQERSERQLMSYSNTEDRYSGIIGAMMTMVQEEEPGPRPWWRRRSIRSRLVFAGWWVRYRSTLQAPFEVEVPLCGQPTIGRYHNHVSAGPKWTPEIFAEGGLYEYTVGGEENGPIETKEITADEVFRDFLNIVTEHLLNLPA
jgi:hypothetical protein